MTGPPGGAEETAELGRSLLETLVGILGLEGGWIVLGRCGALACSLQIEEDIICKDLYQ